jgi:hypothetical protein
LINKSNVCGKIISKELIPSLIQNKIKINSSRMIENPNQKLIDLNMLLNLEKVIKKTRIYVVINKENFKT